MAEHHWLQALAHAIDKWDPGKHPRGRDGKFIETGQFVKVFDGPSGPQIATGMVQAAYFAPDGRLFVGVRTPGNKTEWYRPKQIEHLTVKATLAPSEGVPSMPLPAVSSKDDDVNWDSGPLAGGVPVGDMAVMTPDYKITADTLDPASLEALGAEGPGAYPPPAQVAEQPVSVNIPVGKTPKDVLGLIVTSATNKGVADEKFMADFQTMVDEDNPQAAHKLLSSLMTRAKLGGKQRKRYKAVLDKHLSEGGAVDIEPAAPEPVVPAPEQTEPGVDVPDENAPTVQQLKEAIAGIVEGAEDPADIEDVLDSNLHDQILTAYPEYEHPLFDGLLDVAVEEIKQEGLPASSGSVDAEQLAHDMLQQQPAAEAFQQLSESTVADIHSAGWDIPDGVDGHNTLVEALGILEKEANKNKPIEAPSNPKPGDVYKNGFETDIAIGGGKSLSMYDYYAVYVHPSGSVITVDHAYNVTKWSGTTGKKSSTSATFDKLESGHGQWKQVTSADAVDLSPAKPAKTAAKKVAAAKKAAVPESEPLEPPEPPEPEPEPWPGTTAVNVPFGKTPADLFAMMAITIANKVGPGPDTTKAATTISALSQGVKEGGPSHEEAQAELNKLMSQYGFGGNQRKRYRSLLAMIFGVPVGEKSVPSPTTSIDPTPPGKLGRAVTDAPKGPGIKILNATDGNKMVNPPNISAQQAKSKIQRELNKRLGDVPIEDFIMLSRSKNYTSNAYSKELASAVEGLRKAGKTEYQGFQLKLHLGSYQLIGAPGQSVSLNDLEQALRMTETNGLIRLWAGTSNDSNPRSLAMQRAAKEEFGLGHTYDWPGEHTDAKVTDEYDKYGLLFRRFLREMHTSTQQWLKAEGVTHVRLVRGVKHKSGFANKASAGAGIIGSVKMRPMSSFSTNRSTANGFAGRHGSSSNGTVFWAYVPIERIVGSAMTGFGCQNEYEWVVLAGDEYDRVWIT